MGEWRLCQEFRRMTLSKLIDRLDKSIVHGDLPRAFRNQLSSLREQTEAADAGFQELDARIKELETRIFEEASIRETSRRGAKGAGTKPAWSSELFRIGSCNTVIRVCDDGGNVMETCVLSNAITRSTLPPESRTRISPEPKVPRLYA
jgi:hypothetical protein